jgi:cytidylate kinase
LFEKEAYMAVITLSRQFGSGGDEIAHLICRETGYQFFNKDMIAKAAQEAGMADSGKLVFSENEYHVDSFLDRLLGRHEPLAEMRVWRESVGGERSVETMSLNEDQVLGLVQRAIESAYRLDKFVIVGRGGQVILSDLPGVLHVRVVASMEERIARVRGLPQFSGGDIHRSGVYASPVEVRRAAQDLIIARDSASQAYLHRNFGVDWDNPILYDLILNTTRLSIEAAARMLVEAATQLSQELQPA